MAILYHCDGCGAAVDSPKKVGFVIRREYCDRCAAIADKFLHEEEALRKVTQERFVDERAALIARFSADGLKLPDVPDA